MPAVSTPQQRLMLGRLAFSRLMLAAAHGATFTKAQPLRKTMTVKQLLDYAKMVPKAQR